ncbi:MAG: T9SS type A sorting domain-containing protein, partial [Candidatus Marinimicrobia bacterium]|nr:T9SS type A sorting domain-containing protein [Candidatus Neomarinimicrobiota bacterium]
GPVAVAVFAGENTLTDALSILGDDDTLKLVSSGGIYQLTEKVIVNRKIIIQAAEDLSEKPIITRSSSMTVESALFEMQAFGKLYLKGVTLDGGADAEILSGALIASSQTPFPEYFRVKAVDCNFSSVQNSGNGSFLKFYPGTQADSVLFTNCTFSDCDGIGLRMDGETENSAKYNVQNLEIRNCTFWNIGDEALSIYAGDDEPFSIGPAVKIDHCTFDKCGMSGMPVVHLKEVDNAVVINSIFSNSTLDTVAVTIYGWAYIEYCDIYKAGSVLLERGAHQYDGMVNIDPKYVNATGGDFTLAYSSPVRGIAKDGTAMGDLRWAGNVENSTESDQTLVVTEFELQQNYPNPFNGETRISYTLSKAATVELQIYNLNGIRVAQVKNTHAASGNYSVNWKPEFASSGVYICQLSANGKSKMIKMMYVK